MQNTAAFADPACAKKNATDTGRGSVAEISDDAADSEFAPVVLS